MHPLLRKIFFITSDRDETMICVSDLRYWWLIIVSTRKINVIVEMT